MITLPKDPKERQRILVKLIRGEAVTYWVDGKKYVVKPEKSHAK